MAKRKKNIVVAMSGGVDSSVAAALLVEKGYQVEGVYMWLFDEPQNRAEQRAESRGKNYESGEKYARAVAEKLGIKFRVLDSRKEFKKRVINYFLLEFKAGQTPNPCVVCNQEIKFGLLLDKVAEMGGDYVATGHYARINLRELKTKSTKRLNSKGITRSETTGLKATTKNLKLYRLLMAKDKTKDQSYFLYNLTQEKLAKILFPVGDYKKSEIYKMAEKRHLPYKKGESMDICFVGKRGHREFLGNNLGVKKGKIVDVNDKILGEHQGIWFYTIGQRADIGGPGPFFVVEIDTKKNAVIVSNKFRGEEFYSGQDARYIGRAAFYKKELIAEKINWVVGIEPKMPMRCGARIRYGHEAVECVIKKWNSGRKSAPNEKNERKYKVVFKNPQRAITPGQSVVFYKGNEILGGGVIED